jgi:serine/threonine-protein kinase
MTDSVGGQGPDGSDGAASPTHPATEASPPPTHPAARLAAELRTAAAGGYGKDWEDRGRSHLGEAALLLALLWPSGGTSPVSGTTVEQINANEPTHSAPHPQAQTGDRRTPRLSRSRGPSLSRSAGPLGIAGTRSMSATKSTWSTWRTKSTWPTKSTWRTLPTYVAKTAATMRSIPDGAAVRGRAPACTSRPRAAPRLSWSPPWPAQPWP